MPLSGSWNTRPTCRARRCSSCFVTSMPSSLMLPESGGKAPANDVEQRRLSRAVHPHDRDEVARHERQAHVDQRLHLVGGVPLEGLVEVAAPRAWAALAAARRPVLEVVARAARAGRVSHGRLRGEPAAADQVGHDQHHEHQHRRHQLERVGRKARRERERHHQPQQDRSAAPRRRCACPATGPGSGPRRSRRRRGRSPGCPRSSGC